MVEEGATLSLLFLFNLVGFVLLSDRYGAAAIPLSAARFDISGVDALVFDILTPITLIFFICF